MQRKQRTPVVIAGGMLATLAAVIVLAFGAFAQPSAPGEFDRDAAIEKASSYATGYGMPEEGRSVSAQKILWGDYLESTGARPGQMDDVTKEVWVVVIRGQPFSPENKPGVRDQQLFDNVEVVFDAETGEFRGSGHRRPGTPPPFSE